jgi:hypothetical protein
MSDDLSRIVSSLPESDKDDWDCEVVMTVVRFLVSLSDSLMCPPGVLAEEMKEKSKRIFERINNNILNSLFNSFKKYSNITHELLTGAIICYFHSYEEFKPEMWSIIDLMKKTIEEHSCGKTTVKTNDIVFILNSLRVISRYDNNKKRLIELGFSTLLLKVFSDKNFTVVQYALILFRNLSNSFSSEDAKLVSANVFKVFPDLFKRLTFNTSTIPVPFDSLESALYVVVKILSKDSTSVELLINTSLIQTIINMLPPASSLAVYSSLSFQIERVIIHIGDVLSHCGNSVKNIEKLFNFDFISFYLETFEMMVNEIEKGKMEFDRILREVSFVFHFWLAKSNNEKTLFLTFQKINTIERMINFFIRVKQLNSPSENLRECLNRLALSVCLLFHGRAPLVSAAPVLEYCDKMRKSPPPSEGYNFPENISISWNNMKNPENVLSEWKKK